MAMLYNFTRLLYYVNVNSDNKISLTKKAKVILVSQVHFIVMKREALIVHLSFHL